MIQKSLIVKNASGLHARPASIIVRTLKPLSAEVKLKKKGKIIDARSLLMILSLEVVGGDEVTIIADGPDKERAIEIVYEIINSREEDLYKFTPGCGKKK